MISFSELKRAGFKKAGVWALDEKDEPYLKGSQSSVETGVYLFVTGGKVKYVGRADRLHTRLGSYSRAIRAAKKTSRSSRRHPRSITGRHCRGHLYLGPYGAVHKGSKRLALGPTRWIGVRSY